MKPTPIEIGCWPKPRARLGHWRTLLQPIDPCGGRVPWEIPAGSTCFAKHENTPSALTDIRLFWTMLADAMAGKPKIVFSDETGQHKHVVMAGRSLEQWAARPSIGRLPALARGAVSTTR